MVLALALSILVHGIAIDHAQHGAEIHAEPEASVRIADGAASAATGSVTGAVPANFFQLGTNSVSSSEFGSLADFTEVRLSRWADLPAGVERKPDYFEFVGEAQSVSAADPMFEFTGLRVGEYRLLAERRTSWNQYVITLPVQVRADQTLDLGQLTYSPCSTFITDIKLAPRLREINDSYLGGWYMASLSGPFHAGNEGSPPTWLDISNGVDNEVEIVGLEPGNWLLDLHPIRAWSETELLADPVEYRRIPVQLDAITRFEHVIEAVDESVTIQLAVEIDQRHRHQVSRDLDYFIFDRVSGKQVFDGSIDYDDSFAAVHLPRGSYRLVSDPFNSSSRPKSQEGVADIEFEISHQDTQVRVPVRIAPRVNLSFDFGLVSSPAPGWVCLEVLSLGGDALATPILEVVYFPRKMSRPRPGPILPPGSQVRLWGTERVYIVNEASRLAIQPTPSELMANTSRVPPSVVQDGGNPHWGHR